MQKSYFNSFQLKLLICIIILVNLSGIFYPILRNDDPPLYANIAKHIILSGNWLDLVSQQHDWLDKPHFPFWMTALSFKVFGINSFAYILPGFIFHLLGAYFTYRLAKSLYGNGDIGLIAVVIYLSALHLMMSSIDVRAEAYLLGEIMGACYFWFEYNQSDKIKLAYLLGGAIFTALAMMTKGIFVLVTITGGLIFVWAYTKSLSNLIRPKWLIALLLSFIFTLPEIYALYTQFDLHPEKLVFGHTHVSGIKWFFWDSQFGRFFNNGPISVAKGQDFHYIFFVHTFLWAFLPWSIMFVYVCFRVYKNLRSRDPTKQSEKLSNWYLCGSFMPTFILFSLTKFQLDHYTNIIMPFAAILCARWLYKRRFKHHTLHHPVFYIQIWLAYLLSFLTVVLSLLIFNHHWLILIVSIGIFMLVLFIIFTHKDDLTKAILYPVLAINLVFIFLMQVNQIYSSYDLGYQAATYINHLTPKPVVDYKTDSLTLEFYSTSTYRRVDKINSLRLQVKPYYLVTEASELKFLPQVIGSYNILKHIDATTIDKVLANLLSKPYLKESLRDYVIVEVK